VDILGYFNNVEFFYGGISVVENPILVSFLGCFASNIGIS